MRLYHTAQLAMRAMSGAAELVNWRIRQRVRTRRRFTRCGTICGGGVSRDLLIGGYRPGGSWLTLALPLERGLARAWASRARAVVCRVGCAAWGLARRRLGAIPAGVAMARGFWRGAG